MGHFSSYLRAPFQFFFSVRRPIADSTGLFELKCLDEYDGNQRLFFFDCIFLRGADTGGFFFGDFFPFFFFVVLLKIYLPLKVVLHVRSINEKKGMAVDISAAKPNLPPQISKRKK